MKNILRFFVFSSLLLPVHQLFAQETCELVQTLFNDLKAIKGNEIRPNVFECKENFLIKGFDSGHVNMVEDENIVRWSVTLHSNETGKQEAESRYLELAEELLKCPYLNGWKATEDTKDAKGYVFHINQTMNLRGPLKDIRLAYQRLSFE